MFLLFLLNRDNLFRGPDNANLWFTLLTSLQSQASAKQRPNLLSIGQDTAEPQSKWWFCGTPLKSMLVKSDHLPESKIHIKTCFVTYESMNDEWWLFVTWSKSLWVKRIALVNQYSSRWGRQCISSCAYSYWWYCIHVPYEFVFIKCCCFLEKPSNFPNTNSNNCNN